MQAVEEAAAARTVGQGEGVGVGVGGRVHACVAHLTELHLDQKGTSLSSQPAGKHEASFRFFHRFQRMKNSASISRVRFYPEKFKCFS